MSDRRYCRSYPHCPPEGCWSDRCAVDQPDDGPGSYPPAEPRLHASPEHDGREVIHVHVDEWPRCWSCNAVLPADGTCIDMDCPTCD